MLFNLRALLFALGLFVVVLSSGCGLLGGDDGTDIRVLDAVMSTELTPDQQATAHTTRAFPQGTSRVYAVLGVVGAKAGDEMTGRWYELSADNAGPEGAFVNEGTVTLTQDMLGQEGLARVSFTLTSNTGSLPNGDWALRVYANGDLVRTMAFVISSFVTLPEAPAPGSGDPGATPTAQAGQPTPATQPAPPTATATLAPQPEPTETPAAQPQTYTVQPGDTLTIIAEQFKPADESTDSYVVRLQELNDLSAGSILFVGQMLTLPGPQ